MVCAGFSFYCRIAHFIDALLSHQPTHSDELYKRYEEFREEEGLDNFAAFRFGHGFGVHHFGGIRVLVGGIASPFGRVVVPFTGGGYGAHGAAYVWNH